MQKESVADKADKKKVVSRPVSKKRKLKQTPWWKDIALGIVNLAFVVLLVVLLGKLSGKAVELKRAKGTDYGSVAKSTIEIAGLEIEGNRQKAEELKNLFPNEEGLLDFVREIDVFKEEGVISSFSFASEEYVRDRTGYFGIPFVTEFEGTREQIGEGLNRFQDLPFLFRAVSIETELQPEENLVKFRYGGFLYVDESLAED